jgi:hypothetical protein
MPKHEVGLHIDHEIPIGNRDVEFPVDIDNKAFGRLRISKGGVDWMAAGNWKTRHHVTWKQLAELIQKDGTEYS